MIQREIQLLLMRDPFYPFRIKLVNGDGHDVSYANSVSLLTEGIYIAFFDGNWVEFPYDRVASIESLVVPPEYAVDRP